MQFNTKKVSLEITDRYLTAKVSESFDNAVEFECIHLKNQYINYMKCILFTVSVFLCSFPFTVITSLSEILYSNLATMKL